MAVRAAETDDEQVGVVLVALHFHVGYRYSCHLLRAKSAHEVVVLRLRGDCARLAVLLKSAKNVGVAFLTGYCPVAHE